MKTTTFTPDRYQLTLTWVVVLISILAGLGLLLWGLSPSASLLEHGSGAVRGWPDALFIGGWLLMCVAMMLPTALPLLAAIERLTSQRSDSRLLITIAAGGFLSIWLGAGIAVRGGDILCHTLSQQMTWRSVNPNHVSAGLLSLAGIYLLSPIAQNCVSACQSPMGFIAPAWTGQPNVKRQVAQMGWAYGLSCFGCCWPLMVLMCALGMGNPVWMLLFTLIMIGQKHDRYGRFVTTACGVILLIAAAVMLCGTVSLPHPAHRH
jgi:predicted metal-binding membrane protein